MSISADVRTVLTLAIELREKLKSQEATPLRIWAVLLAGADNRLQHLGWRNRRGQRLSAIRSEDHQ